MKMVKLFTGRLIAGQMRYPVEGAISVSDDDAEDIKTSKAGEIVNDEKPKAKSEAADKAVADKAAADKAAADKAAADKAAADKAAADKA